MRKPWKGLRSALLSVPSERQGAHPDPTDPNASPPVWADWIQPLMSSASFKAFEAVMQTPTEADVRAAVLRELSAYWGRSVEETLERCINAEDYSAEEWK